MLLPRIQVDNVTEFDVDSPIRTNQHIICCPFRTSRRVIRHFLPTDLDLSKSDPKDNINYINFIKTEQASSHEITIHL